MSEQKEGQPNHNQATGKKGEEIAREYLENKGFEILATNWRHSYCEVDLICKKRKMIVFVEVKSRSTDAFGVPETAVGKEKQRQLVKAADAYIFKTGWEGELRFDIVSVTYRPGGASVYHIEDAFYPYQK